MKLKKNEISFIISHDINSDHFTTQLYNNLTHSKNNNITKNKKLVILYCSDDICLKTLRNASKNGIINDIIQIQPYTLTNKVYQYQVIQHKNIIPCSNIKFFLKQSDNPSDYLVKPTTGMWGKGINVATSPNVHNKFFQKKIEAIREFQIIITKQSDKNDILIVEKTPNTNNDLKYSISNNYSKMYTLYHNGILNPSLSRETCEQLLITSKMIMNELHYDYSVIDIIQDIYGKLQFLECNSLVDNIIKNNSLSLTEEVIFNMFNKLFNLDYEFLYNRFYKKINGV